MRSFLVEFGSNVIIARIGLVPVDSVGVLARIVPRVLFVLVGLREDAVVAVVAETVHATQHFTREGLTGLDVLVGTCFVITLAYSVQVVSYCACNGSYNNS